MSDSHVPCRAHAIPDRAILLKATAELDRRERTCWLTVCVRLLPAITQSSTKVLIRRLPISDAGGHCKTKHRFSCTRKRVVAAHYKKDDVTQFGYFRLPCGLSRTRHYRSMAWARHGMCELTHGMAVERHGNGMGAAWERHAMSESALIRPLEELLCIQCDTWH